MVRIRAAYVAQETINIKDYYGADIRKYGKGKRLSADEKR
jgi:hypothetical protein